MPGMPRCHDAWGFDPSNLALWGRSPSLGLRSEMIQQFYENVTKTERSLWILLNSPCTLLALSIFSRFSSARFQLHICWQKWKNSTMNCEMRNLAETRITARISKTKHCLRLFSGISQLRLKMTGRFALNMASFNEFFDRNSPFHPAYSAYSASISSICTSLYEMVTFGKLWGAWLLKQ